MVKRGERDDNKLTIQLRMPGGVTKTFEYPHQPVNWNMPPKALNRWRSQIFRYAPYMSGRCCAHVKTPGVISVG